MSSTTVLNNKKSMDNSSNDNDNNNTNNNNTNNTNNNNASTSSGSTDGVSKSSIVTLDVDGRNAVLDSRQFKLQYNPANNRTSPILDKFKIALILGKRATQLANGAPALIEVPEGVTDVKEIAKMELRAKETPYIVEVDAGNGHMEYWRIRDMIVNLD